MKRDLTSFIEQTGQPPALPTLYYELMQVMAEADSSLDDVAHLILQDQGMAARILRLSNSAIYGCASRISTIHESVQLLGLREVQNLVLATSVIKAFRGFPPGLLDVPAFWTHSIACGIASAYFAEQRGELLPERLFVAGLLHDVGRLMMCLGAPSESREILERSRSENQISMVVERDVLGFDHALLGAELAWMWKLPKPLVDVIESHHGPPAGDTELNDTWLVHYADFVVNVLQIGNSGEYFVTPLATPVNETDFGMEHIEESIAEIEKRCQDVYPILLGADR